MEQYIPKFGAIYSPYDVRDYVGMVPRAVVNEKVPDMFEIPMCEIKNQGNVGSCTAHSMAAIIEYFNKKQQGVYIPMSVGYIYGNRELTPHKGAGYVLRTALQVASQYGDAPASLFPYNKEVPTILDLFQSRDTAIDEKAYPNRISSYYRLESISDIKYNLLHNGPVIFAMEWCEGATVKDGVLRFKTTEVTGSHCMVIYGWNKDGWKIQNSWGMFWGQRGCAILPYDYPIREAWGVIDTNVIKDDQMVIVKPNWFKKTFGKMINFCVRLFKKKI